MPIAIKMAGKEIASYDTTTDKVAIKLGDDVSINDSAGNVVLNESGGSVNLGDSITFSANHAGIKTALNASGDAPVFACRAWVNFNGTLDENENIDGSLTTGENVYIRNAGNVSSVNFNGTGDYTINFATAMPDENYSVNASPISGTRSMLITTNSLSTGSVRVQINYVNFPGGNTPSINVACSVAVFR